MFCVCPWWHFSIEAKGKVREKMINNTRFKTKKGMETMKMRVFNSGVKG